MPSPGSVAHEPATKRELYLEASGVSYIDNVHVYMYIIHVSKKSTVREPVQVYLDPNDKSLLDQLADQTGLSRAELLRRGLRRLADTLLQDTKPGSSLDAIIGALGNAKDLPTDLASRHDEYLYGSRAD